MPPPSSTPSRTAPPRLADFSIRVPETIRFGDIDRQGHVNNAVYPTYFESGRVGTIYDQERGLLVPGSTTVLARIEIDFLRELRWPGSIEIGSAVSDIGRSSYTFLQAIFHDEICAAIGRSTMVLIDADTRRARPLPPELLGRLKELAFQGR